MAVSTAMLVSVSCSDENCYDFSDFGGVITGISATSEQWIAESGPSRALDVNSQTGGLAFSWALGDVLGIYPIGGDQVSFPISSGAGSSEAKFDGGSWALRSSFQYAGYYPFSADNYHIAMTQIPVSLIGQKQDGNNSLANASPFDYQAASATQPATDGSVMLNFKHLCSFMKLKLTMVKPGTYTHVKVTSDKTQFGTKAKYDLSAATPSLVATETSSSVEMDLTNITTTAVDQLVTIYNLAVPIDLLGSNLSIEVTDNTGTKYYSAATVSGKTMLAGHMYGYAANIGSHVSAITVSGSKTEIYEGETLQLSANVTPGNATTKSVEWKSNNTTVATVSSSGLVTGKSAGTATITAVAKDGSGVSGAFQIKVSSDPFTGHEYVDLGLKDSQGNPIYWATCNVGANNPEDAGYYFAWGDTDENSFHTTWNIYFDARQSGNDIYFMKYKNSTGGKTILEEEEDIAHVHWKGIWRMPTEAELDQLDLQCTWTWDGINKGYKVSKKGDSSKYIFLPAAGLRSGHNYYYKQQKGYYWSSTLSPYNEIDAVCMEFDSSNSDWHYGTLIRKTNLPVRPVCTYKK